jgi:ABC-type phosphate transport system substrate-binding protein
MSNYVKLATDAGDQYLASIAETQENFLKATMAFAARFTPITPVATPAFVAPELPTAQEVTEATFAFAQKLLKQQKSFAEKLLSAGTPAK